MTMLSSSSPVTATTHVGRPLDPGALEHEELGRVAAVHLVLELGLELVEAVRRAARSASPRGRRGSAPARGSSRPCRRLRSGGTSRRAAPFGARTAFVERLDRALGRADDVQAARREELGAGRVEDADDRPSGTSNCFCAIWPITMFELSPSVVTTTASASSMPASRSSWMSMPWPTWNSPVQSSPRRAERVLALVDDAHVPARPCSSRATALPTRPQPTTITFMRGQRSAQDVPRPATRPCSQGRELLVEHPLRETRRSAPRRAPGGARSRPSARRSATGGASAARSRARSGRRPTRGPASTIASPIARARTVVADDLDAVLLAEQPAPRRARPRRAAPRARIARRSARSSGTRIDVQRLDERAVLARELDGGRDHLLADDARASSARGSAGTGAPSCSGRSSGAMWRS